MRKLRHKDVNNLPMASKVVGPVSELWWSDPRAPYSPSVIQQICEYLPESGDTEMQTTVGPAYRECMVYGLQAGRGKVLQKFIPFAY